MFSENIPTKSYRVRNYYNWSNLLRLPAFNSNPFCSEDHKRVVEP